MKSIKAKSIVIFVSLMMLLFSGVANAKQEKTPPGSYLTYRATTVKELSQQIATDPIVKARYAKHFNISGSEVSKRLNSSLQLVSLKETKRLSVWYISKAGIIKKKTKILPKGTMVFAAADGKPVLAWSCGNPLTPSMPRAHKKSPVVTKVLASPLEEISAAVPVTTSPEMIEALPVVEMPAAAPPIVGAIAAPAISAPSMFSGLSKGLGLLGALVPLMDKESKTPVVPEPSGALVLLGGLSFAGASLKYKLKRRRK